MKTLREIVSRRTTYDDNYATCARTCAKLFIYPGENSPDWVSKSLMIEPTNGSRKGEILLNRMGGARHAKLNFWFLSSEGKISSLDLRRHLDWLLDKLEPVSSRILDLQRVPGVTMAINCVWWSSHGHGGPILWHEQMQRMAMLNLDCGFDIYFFGDDT
jgi:hypothetical protein